jgi:hypothetical protein
VANKRDGGLAVHTLTETAPTMREKLPITWRKGMDKKPKSYAQILAQYNKKMAPIRKKRMEEAKKRINKFKKLEKPKWYFRITKTS